MHSGEGGGDGIARVLPVVAAGKKDFQAKVVAGI
jgi:hypothetical protein